MSFLETVLATAAPHACLICGEEGKLVCAWCAPDAFGELPSRCYRCKKLTKDFAVCDSCRRDSKLRHVWVRTIYEQTAKDLLRAYKFERVQAAAKTIARAMDEILPYLPDTTLLVAVPTATSRIRQRGYDHAELLARAVATKRNWLWAHSLANLGQSRQVGANRQERLRQLEGHLMVTKRELVHKADILLVDDVVTTGATIETAATVLKQAGAKSVSALVFAQKQ